jgi:Family of unknown function (DUF5686)
LGDKSWSLGKKSGLKLDYHSPFTDVIYNTVEGFVFNFGLGLSGSNWRQIEAMKKDSTLKDKPLPYNKNWSLMPLGRYSFARNLVIGKMTFHYNWAKGRNFMLEGGRFVEQLNGNRPISNFMNTAMTLLWEQNWQRLYEKDYLAAAYRHTFNDKWKGEINLEFADRRSLRNHSAYKWVDRENADYMPNEPTFEAHKALTMSIKAEGQPWLKYRVSNGYKRIIEGSSPELTFEYRRGFTGIAGSTSDFDVLEVGGKHTIKIGRRAVWNISGKAGAFLNNSKVYFPDFKHFRGNRTPIQTTHDGYRLLDYYQYSTSDQYLEIMTNYQFRKLFLTQIVELRFLGFKENLFVNYLLTPQSKHYTEVGYAFDGIMKFIRLEAIASFQDGKYMDYGFRVGIVRSFGGIQF